MLSILFCYMGIKGKFNTFNTTFTLCISGKLYYSGNMFRHIFPMFRPSIVAKVRIYSRIQCTKLYYHINVTEREVKTCESIRLLEYEQNHKIL